MKQSISLDAFRDAFTRAGRSTQFSYDGLRVLFDHLEALEDDMGQEIELDVIALCCDYSEDDAETVANDYGIEIDDCPDDDAVRHVVMNYLEENTDVAGVTSSGAIVFHQF